MKWRPYVLKTCKPFAGNQMVLKANNEHEETKRDDRRIFYSISVIFLLFCRQKCQSNMCANKQWNHVHVHETFVRSFDCFFISLFRFFIFNAFESSNWGNARQNNIVIIDLSHLMAVIKSKRQSENEKSNATSNENAQSENVFFVPFVVSVKSHRNTCRHTHTQSTHVLIAKQHRVHCVLHWVFHLSCQQILPSTLWSLSMFDREESSRVGTIQWWGELVLFDTRNVAVLRLFSIMLCTPFASIHSRSHLGIMQSKWDYRVIRNASDAFISLDVIEFWSRYKSAEEFSLPSVFTIETKHKWRTFIARSFFASQYKLCCV